MRKFSFEVRDPTQGVLGFQGLVQPQYLIETWQFQCWCFLHPPCRWHGISKEWHWRFLGYFVLFDISPGGKDSEPKHVVAAGWPVEEQLSSCFRERCCCWCCPKFTFPTFTPDPNLHTPHIYTRPKFTQTQIYTRPKFTQTQIYTNPFLDIYFNKPKFTQPKFTQNPNLHNPNLHNPNLHKNKKKHNFALQIYTKLNPNYIRCNLGCRALACRRR